MTKFDRVLSTTRAYNMLGYAINAFFLGMALLLAVSLLTTSQAYAGGRCSKFRGQHGTPVESVKKNLQYIASSFEGMPGSQHGLSLKSGGLTGNQYAAIELAETVNDMTAFEEAGIRWVMPSGVTVRATWVTILQAKFRTQGSTTEKTYSLRDEYPFIWVYLPISNKTYTLIDKSTANNESLYFAAVSDAEEEQLHSVISDIPGILQQAAGSLCKNGRYLFN